jgi:uncharacterized membrane protein YkoI
MSVMKPIIGCGLTAFSLAVILSTALAAADDAGRAGGDHPLDPAASADVSPGSLFAVGDRDGDKAVDADQDRARELVEHGVIRPLRDILERVRAEAPGDVVGVNLSRRSGRWVYGLRVLTPAGRRVEIAIDAGTMAILPASR